MVSSREIRAGAAYIELYANDNKLVRGLNGARKRLKAFAAGVRNIGMKTAALGAVMATPFIAGAKVFAEFEQQMANVSTMLDEPQKHMGNFTKAIRSMAVEFGESTEALAGGLYDILSASIAPAKALDVLAASVKAAKAGMTDTKTSADAITTILNSYGLAAEKATDVSDWFFTVVKRGKTTFAELAPAIGLVASSAASGGVGLNELGASIATLTRAGVRTERAVTAVNAMIMGFLKPTAEASAYARKLGFEMSSATLKSQGLAGVFAKISKLPPDAIAKLFPNIRALRGVIPALKNIKSFTEDVAAMGNRTGKTQTAYEKMSKTLMHSFNQVKQSALVAMSVLGEALAEPLAEAAKIIKKFAGSITDLIANNKALVVTAVKIIAAVIAGGVAMVVFGGIISVLATTFGVLSAIITGVGTAIGILGAVLGAVLSPIGLVITAVAALGAYLIYTTGAGAKALGWLGGKFSQLKDDAKQAYSGISKALAAGDIGLAAKILWLTLKMEWKKGVHALNEMWVGFKEKFLSITDKFVYGGQIIWTNFVYKIRTLWSGLTGFLKTTWTKFTAWFGDMFSRTFQFVMNQWYKIRGIFDEDFDVESAIAIQADVSADRRRKIKRDEKADLADIEKNKLQSLSDAESKRDAKLKKLINEYSDRRNDRQRKHADQLSKTQSEIDKARSEWLAALKQASESGTGVKDDTPPGIKSPEQLIDKVRKSLSGLGQTMNRAGKIGAKGTFNAAAIRGLAAGGATDRIAKATEDTAKTNRRIEINTKNIQPAFG